MTLFRNTANGGTNGAGATGALTFANSTNSGVALTPVGVAAQYSATNVLTGHGPLSYRLVTPAGASNFTSVISGSPTSMSVTFYDYIDTANTSTSEAHSLRNGTTRVTAINYANTQKVQFFGVSSTPVFTSTVSIPVSGWFRHVYTYDSSGNWTYAWYMGDSLTPIETPASGTADFSSAGAPTIISFGKRSGGWTGTRDMDDVAWDTNSSTPIPPTGTTVGPLGVVAHIGDSTSSQDGNGAINVPARYVAGGWWAGDISFYGVGSKRIDAPDANGKTTIQNIQDARAVVSQEPAVWVIALGTNFRHETDAQTLIEVTDVMNEINSVGSPGKVLWVGISQSTAGGGLDANAARRNAYISSLAGTTFPTMTWVNLDAYLRNGRDERDIWFSPPDANFAHMSVGGYVLRNSYIATQARKLVTGLPNVILDLNGSGSLVGNTPYYFATPALSGSGSLSQSGVPGGATTPSLSGAGTLSVAIIPKPAQTPSLTGSGSLGVQVSLTTASAAVGLSGSGLLLAGTGAGSAPNLTGSGSLGVATTVKTTGTVSLSGSGSLGTAGAAGFARTATLSGSGALSAVLTPRPTSTVFLSGSGSLAASASPVAVQAVLLAGMGSLSTDKLTPPYNVGSYNYTALRVREYHGYIPPRSDE